MIGLDSPAWLMYKKSFMYRNTGRLSILPQSPDAKLAYLTRLIEIFSEDDELDKAAKVKDDWGGAKQW